MYFLLQKKGEMGVLQKESWGKNRPSICDELPDAEHIHGSVSVRKEHKLICTIQVPMQEELPCDSHAQMVPLLGQGYIFSKIAFVIEDARIFFVDYDGLLERILEEADTEFAEKTPVQILYRLFCKLVENDVHVLDVIYKQLAALEREIPKENGRFFLQKMYTMKHSIYQFFRYYHQLTEMADDLMEWECELLPKEEMKCFEKFVLRTKRLADDMEIMPEYAMEICEIYQSQINIRQNDIMKILTIVTTIFLPLSLLAGWYGMNFEYMPEISWKYGYLMAIFVSVCIVIFCLIIFRKKKYW